MKIHEIGFVILEGVVIIGIIMMIGIGLKICFRPEYNIYDINRDGTVDRIDYDMMLKYVTAFYDDGIEA